MSPEIAAAFARAQKELWAGEGETTLLDRAAIEAILPHRDPFLLLDRVTTLGETVGARYDLRRASDVFAGHFPGQPVWPGVLQIETIAQAGLLLFLQARGEAPPAVALTHVLAARFVRPVQPLGELHVAARIFEDGLFFTIVGQCTQGGRVCSAAVVSGV